MRYRQSFTSNDLIVEEEDIQIDDARAPFEDPFPAHGYFDILKDIEELIGRKARFDLDHAIDKPILLGVADGFRLIEGGLSDEAVLLTLAYFGDCSPAVFYLVPNVGTDSDKSDIFHNEGVYGCTVDYTEGEEWEKMRTSGGDCLSVHYVSFNHYFWSSPHPFQVLHLSHRGPWSPF